jgi:hypothetical protein
MNENSLLESQCERGQPADAAKPRRISINCGAEAGQDRGECFTNLYQFAVKNYECRGAELCGAGPGCRFS